MKKRILSLILCAAMLLALAPAASADGGNYLVLGDSISTGYGLADPETEGFASIVANAAGYAIDNRAVNGNTADGILNQFKAAELNETVSVADVITITCGGNDLMAVLYEAISEAYNEAYPDEPILADQVTELMGGEAELDMTKMLEMFDLVLGILNGDEEAGVPKFVESEELAAALAQYVENLNEIIGIIRSLNDDVTIVVATQYHPYATFTGTFAALNSEIGVGVEMLSDAIAANADTAGYLVADVHAAFAEAYASGENLCNANGSLLSLNLDFHPNAAGHALIAEVMLETLGVQPTDEPTVEPSTEPTAQPETPTDTGSATGGIAIANKQSVLIDGIPVEFEVYALVDANGGETNYIKLRDLAFHLNGTAAQFEVDWDGTINILDGVPYTANGSEMHTPFEGDRAYTPTDAVTKVDGTVTEFDAICLTDDDGGEYNYYKLRDLGKALGFDVSWTYELGIFIETDQPYTDD